MKSWVPGITVVVLVLSIIANGILFYQLHNDIDDTQSQVAALKSNSPNASLTATGVEKAGADLTMIDLIP